MTEKQMRFLRGIHVAHYPTLSASEAGDPEIAHLLDAKEHVLTYWGVGGTHLKLTDTGWRLIGMEPPK